MANYPKSDTLWPDFSQNTTLLTEVQNTLDPILKRVIGCQLVSLGSFAAQLSTYASPAIRHCKVSALTGADIQSDNLSLALGTKTCDALVSAFELEFSKQPYVFLREIERVLQTDGHLILIGFNPFGLLASTKHFPNKRNRPPYNGDYFRVKRIVDWLQLLGFTLETEQYCFHQFGVSKKDKFWPFSEHISHWFPKLGSVYVLHARKYISPLTPTWQKSKRRINQWQPIAQGANWRDTPHQ